MPLRTFVVEDAKRKLISMVRIALVVLFVVLHEYALAAGILAPKPLVIAPTGYQYGASIMYDEGIYKMWWCGDAGLPGIEDGIFYATSPDGATWSIPQLVFTRAPGPFGLENGNQAWDGAHVCDPSVVKGATPGWAYTMYYTGINTCCTTQNDTNGLGVALSQDGIQWVRYGSSPIRKLPATVGVDFGTGVPTAVVLGGTTFVLYFYSADSFGVNQSILTSAPDGLGFSGDFDVTGAVGLGVSDGLYDPITGSVWILRNHNGLTEPLGGIEVFQNGVPRGVLTPSITGQPRNHNAGFVRNPQGLLLRPDIQLIFAQGAEDPFTWGFRRALVGLFDFEDGVDPGTFTALVQTAGVSPPQWAWAGNVVGDNIVYFDCLGDGLPDGYCDIHLVPPEGARDWRANDSFVVLWVPQTSGGESSGLEVWLRNDGAWFNTGQLLGVCSGCDERSIFPLPAERNNITEILLRVHEADWGGVGKVRTHLFSITLEQIGFF